VDSQWSKTILKGENESQYKKKHDLVHGCFWLGFAFFFGVKEQLSILEWH
jgi:hypothetical protein